jgi:hypothetical protein
MACTDPFSDQYPKMMVNVAHSGVVCQIGPNFGRMVASAKPHPYFAHARNNFTSLALTRVQKPQIVALKHYHCRSDDWLSSCHPRTFYSFK